MPRICNTLYSGAPLDKKGHSGVDLLIDKKYKQNIENEQYINDTILQVTVITNNESTHFISVYAPNISKKRETREKFYEELQTVVDSIKAQDKIIIMGDLNARIGNEPLGGTTQRFNEETVNDSGDMLKMICALNKMRINNTFFDHDISYKYTWKNTKAATCDHCPRLQR